MGSVEQATNGDLDKTKDVNGRQAVVKSTSNNVGQVLTDNKSLKYNHPSSQTNWGSQDFLYVARYQDDDDNLGGCLRLHFQGLIDKEKRMSNHKNYALIVNNFDLNTLDDLRDFGLLKTAIRWSETILNVFIEMLRKETLGKTGFSIEGKIFNPQEANLDKIRQEFQLYGHSEEKDKALLSIVRAMKKEGFFIDLKYLVDKKYSYLQDLLENGKGDEKILIRLVDNIDDLSIDSLNSYNIVKGMKDWKIDIINQIVDKFGKINFQTFMSDSIQNLIKYAKHENLLWLFNNFKDIQISDLNTPFMIDIVCNLDLDDTSFTLDLTRDDFRFYSKLQIQDLYSFGSPQQIKPNIQELLKKTYSNMNYYWGSVVDTYGGGMDVDELLLKGFHGNNGFYIVNKKDETIYWYDTDNNIILQLEHWQVGGFSDWYYLHFFNKKQAKADKLGNVIKLGLYKFLGIEDNSIGFKSGRMTRDYDHEHDCEKRRERSRDFIISTDVIKKQSISYFQDLLKPILAKLPKGKRLEAVDIDDIEELEKIFLEVCSDLKKVMPSWLVSSNYIDELKNVSDKINLLEKEKKLAQ